MAERQKKTTQYVVGVRSHPTCTLLDVKSLLDTREVLCSCFLQNKDEDVNLIRHLSEHMLFYC